jgi:uncharacterized protein DUF4328
MTYPYYQPPQPPPRYLKPLDNLASWTNTLILISVGLDVLQATREWADLPSVRDRVESSPDYSALDLVESQSSDSLDMFAGFGTIAAAVLFMIWLWNARQNAQLLHPATHRRDIAWAIAGWFVPVVNFWFPYQVFDDVYRASNPAAPRDVARARDLPGSPGVIIWWLTWLGSGVLVGVAAGVFVVNDLTVDDYVLYLILTTVGAVVQGVAGGVVVQLVRQITNWQATPRWWPPAPQPQW